MLYGQVGLVDERVRVALMLYFLGLNPTVSYKNGDEYFLLLHTLCLSFMED